MPARLIQEDASSTLSASPPRFSYESAFSRNLGFVTEWEQQILRSKRIALAGMGGVGGVHLVTLTRFGIGNFHIADFDTFELGNFNRQYGATVESIGRPKVEVMAENALKVNPELNIKQFPTGVDDSNLAEFLDGVDLYVDSLDFFVLGIRRKIYALCAEKGIPVVCAGPLGMGTAFLVFKPGGPTFEDWFQLEGLSEQEQYIKWYVGLAPSMLQASYVVDRSRVDFKRQKGPSTVAGCELCAGVASVEAVKLLLGRGQVRAVPYYQHFDAYKGRFIAKKLRFGNRSLSQRLKVGLAKRFLKKLNTPLGEAAPDPVPVTELEQILDLARWAPSGDNGQPWRFEIVDQSHIVIHVEGSGDVYDYHDGQPTLLSVGCLLETLRIAASGYGRAMTWTYLGRTDRTHRIAVELTASSHLPRDDLGRFVTLRSVNRAAYRQTPLSQTEKAALERTLGADLAIDWHESFAARWAAAKINARSTNIRLRIPEAYRVHHRMIDWTERFSRTGLPAGAVGLDRLTLKLMKWLMASWSRMRLMNQIAGTSLAQLELDIIPGLCSAAHFTIRQATHAEKSPEFLLSCGQSLQRFWLTATKLGLAMQPHLASLCFESYGRDRIAFTDDKKILAAAERLSIGSDPTAVFKGRIGQPKLRLSLCRSIRRRLDDLILRDERTAN